MNDSLFYAKGKDLELMPFDTVCDLLKQYARLTPSAPAVVDDEGILTYADVDRLSDSWAKILLQSGVGDKDIIAIMLPRCKEYLVILFAVFKTGAAYLPLDMNYPKERLDYMIESSGSKKLITNLELIERYPVGVENYFCIDRIYEVDDSIRLPKIERGQRAYVIYTSGSTGQPKGVAISHDSLMHLLSWFGSEIFNCTAQDRFCAVNSFSFDASIVDLFPPIVAGASVYIVSDAVKGDLTLLRRYIIEHQLTLGVFTTRFGYALLDKCTIPLRAVVLAGEKLNALPHTQCPIINGYGPTEFTVCSNYYRVEEPVDHIPIGIPAPNSYSYVLDEKLQFLPVGEVGELYLSGGQIAAGYLNDEKQTIQRFIVNPYAVSEDTRLMYRTGDMVRWNSKGLLEYVGRKDTQVKVRGFRIDLMEIENQIKKFKGIVQTAVIVQEVGGHPHICGYYVSDQDKVDDPALKDYLTSKLPHYFLPDYLIQIPSIPLTVNGKLDKEQLPLPEMAFLGQKATNSREQILLTLAIRLMKTSVIGVTDDLVDAGMDSILSMLFTAAANEAGIAIQVSDIYRYRTIRALVEEANIHHKSQILRWIHIDAEKPLVVLLSGATPATMLDTFIKCLEEHFSVLLFDPIVEQYIGNESKANFKDWIDLHIEHLQHQITSQQQVYAFAGHCLAGELAFALAERWSGITKQQPKVWMFNSLAMRKIEKTDYQWSLTPIQQLLFDKWLAVANIANQLMSLREMSVYAGNVVFFYASTFTPNLLLPELPPITTDPEELEELRRSEVQNMEDWKTLAPGLNIVSLNATHWTIFSPMNLRIIMDYLLSE